MKRYNLMLGPADLDGTQTLTYRYDRDTRRSDKWLTTKSRRTRKVVDNPYEAPGNGELLAEDIWGFYGYLHAYEWSYRGEQVVLAPGPIHAAAPTWGGRGNWYPVDPWELRRARVVEARPKEHHPLTAAACSISTCRPGSCSTAWPTTIAAPTSGRLSMCITIPRITPGTMAGDSAICRAGVPGPSVGRAGIFQVYKVLSDRPLTELRLGFGA